MRIFSHKNRPVHLGPFALERLERTDQVPDIQPGKHHSTIAVHDTENPNSLTNAIATYLALFDRLRVGPADDQNPPSRILSTNAQTISRRPAITSMQVWPESAKFRIRRYSKHP